MRADRSRILVLVAALGGLALACSSGGGSSGGGGTSSSSSGGSSGSACPLSVPGTYSLTEAFNTMSSQGCTPSAMSASVTMVVSAKGVVTITGGAPTATLADGTQFGPPKSCAVSPISPAGLGATSLTAGDFGLCSGANGTPPTASSPATSVLFNVNCDGAVAADNATGEWFGVLVDAKTGAIMTGSVAGYGDQGIMGSTCFFDLSGSRH